MNEASFVAGRDNKGAFATGEESTATATINETIAPDPNIDILAVLAALQSVLTCMPGIERKALTRIEEAREEAVKPEPKRDEVKRLVAQATQYAKDAATFSDAVEKLKPNLMQIAAWTGSTWQAWAPMLGLG